MIAQKNLPDAQRPLTKKGEKTAAGMGKKMKKGGMSADVWISSTANRAVETAHIFAKEMGRSVHKIMLKKAVYDADRPEALAEVISGLKDKHASAILFGHNPVLSDLTAFYVRDFGESLPKSGLAVITWQVEKWNEISPGTGTLKHFDFPGKDSALYDQMEKDLKDHLKRELTGILARLDEPAAVKSRKLINKTSRELTKSFMKTIREQSITENQKIRLERVLVSPDSKAAAKAAKTTPKTEKPKAAVPAKTPPEKTAGAKTDPGPKAAPKKAAAAAETKKRRKPAAESKPAPAVSARRRAVAGGQRGRTGKAGTSPAKASPVKPAPRRKPVRTRKQNVAAAAGKPAAKPQSGSTKAPTTAKKPD